MGVVSHKGTKLTKGFLVINILCVLGAFVRNDVFATTLAACFFRKMGQNEDGMSARGTGKKGKNHQ